MCTKEEMIAVMNAMSTTELSQLSNDALRIIHARRSDALKTVIQIIGEYGFTAAELGFEITANAPESKKAEPAARSWYRHPNIPTETWSGRGRKPGWLLDLLAEGWTLDKLRVVDEEDSTVPVADEELSEDAPHT
ncbi:DNA-binding protein H-NS [Gammaproteobacteria bacterium]